MRRALLFLVKTGLLVALAVWVSDQKGSVEIEWGAYTIIFPHIGFFLLTVIAAVLLAIFIYRVIQTFAHFPRSFARYQEIKRQEKGYRALTLGLTAVAAGDKKIAAYQSHRTGKLLSEETGLPLLLKAQAERLQGKEKEAQETFAALTQDKDAAFLGVRGLLQTALEARDYSRALELARQALRLHPRQPWILKLVYDLEIRQRHWEEAQSVLYRAEKTGTIPVAQANSDRIAILLARAEEERNNGARNRALQHLRQAWKYDPSFVPAALALAKFYKQENGRRKAAAVIETAWKKSPHPDLGRVWEMLAPPEKPGKHSARFAWAERLAALNPNHPESHLLAGRTAMEESLWGEAREHFRKAENLEASGRLYWLWANLEKRSGAGVRLVQALQEKAASFPPERCWVCRETGRIYEQWFPVAEPHGSFNTIEWNQPLGYTPMLANDAPVADVVLEVPRSYSTL